MKKIKITESTLSRIIERMLKEQSKSEDVHQLKDLEKQIKKLEKDFGNKGKLIPVKKLEDVLVTWENKEYSSDKARWKEYYKDIEKIVKNS